MAINIDRTIGAFFDSSQGRLRRIGNYIGPASYVTGGDPIAPADVAMGRIEHFDVANAFDRTNTQMRIVAWDPVAKTIVWYVPNTGAEVAPGTNLSTFNARFEAIGQ